MFANLLFSSCVHFSSSKPGHSGTRRHFLQATSRIYTARSNMSHTVLYVQGVHMFQRRRILRPRPDPWTLEQANRFCHVDVPTGAHLWQCLRIGAAAGRSKNTAAAGSVTSIPEDRNDWSMIIARRSPSWRRPLLHSGVVGATLGRMQGHQHNFSRVAFVEACRPGPGCVLSECWNLQSIFSAGILGATIKEATGKATFSHRRSGINGQAGLACSRSLEEAG